MPNKLELFADEVRQRCEDGISTSSLMQLINDYLLQSALDADEIVALAEQIDMDFDTLKDCIPNKNDRDVFFKPIQSRIKELSSLLGGKNGTSA